MRSTLLLFLSIIGLLNVSAQSNEKENQRLQILPPAKSLNINKEVTPKTESVQLNQEQKVSSEREATVEGYDALIAAIEFKVQAVKNDPIEDAKAIESGWYDSMEKQLKAVVKSKDELIETNK